MGTWHQKPLRFSALGAAAALALSWACGPTTVVPDGGRTCPDGTIDTGAGCALRRPLGQACTAATACESGYCTDGVCCESACGGPCLRCDGQGQCVPEPQRTLEEVCGAYACGEGRCLTQCTRDTHCAPDAHCENRQCVAARGEGAFCTADNQCKSRHCIDGYCCDSACDGACDACSLPGSEGRCSTVALGTTGSPSCGSFSCDGQNAACPQGCATDAVCAPGRYCDSQGACAPKRATGTACAEPRECLSGHCADGYCCDSACTGQCDVCDASGDEGTCRFAAAGAAGAPACAPFVCTGLLASCPPTCSSDFHCVQGRFCAAGGCQPQKPNGQSCAEGRECQSGFCSDGVCCNQQCSAQCDACNQPGTVGQCTLLALSALGNPPCSPYSCNGLTANCGLACTAVGPGAPCSSQEWCDGTACARKGVPGTVCTQGYQCESGSCVDGYCCDTACSGACDRCDQRGFLGTCRPEPVGTVVLACGNYTCDGSSGACPAACTTDVHCIGSMWCQSNACVPRLPAGSACSRDGACQSGHCVDDTCCDTNCANACDQCNLLGLEGTCSVASAGATPQPACGLYVCGGLSVGCPATCLTDSDCTQDAWCNAGGCEPRRPQGHPCGRDRQCAQGMCADGFCCDARCDGACDTCAAQPGTCTALVQGSVGNPSCSPFLCDGALMSCPQTCEQNQDCAAGYYCTGPGGTCAQKLPDGALCGSNNAVCISGNCADGRCCNAPCQGACEACDLNPGTCTAYSAGDPGQPVCGAYVCNGALGTCPTSCPGAPNVQAGCAPTHFCVSGQCTPKRALGDGCFNGLECNSGFCADGVCCDTACAGACDACNLTAGTCTPRPAGAPGAPTCFPYTCTGADAGCPGSCGGDAECATNSCVGGECQKRALAEGCEASFECASNCCDRDTLVCATGPQNCL